jgi:hypothetical protein
MSIPLPTAYFFFPTPFSYYPLPIVIFPTVSYSRLYYPTTNARISSLHFIPVSTIPCKNLLLSLVPSLLSHNGCKNFLLSFSPSLLSPNGIPVSPIPRRMQEFPTAFHPRSYKLPTDAGKEAGSPGAWCHWATSACQAAGQYTIPRTRRPKYRFAAPLGPSLPSQHT